MTDSAAENRDRRPPFWIDRLLVLFRRRRWRGFTLLCRLLRPSGGRRGLCARTRYGTRFFLNPSDYVDSFVIDEGFYESEVLEAVRPHLGPQAVLWVIGANFGLHAVTAKALHPEARVIAFEPLPQMASRLMENSDLNGAVVELNAYALSDQVATLPFFANTAGNPAMSTLFPSPDGSYGMQINVATTTAAEVVRSGRAPLPTAIILDAEGAEAAILRGFGAIVSHPGLRVIVFEAAADLLAGPRASEVLDILRAAGFGIEPLVRRERTGHSLANFAARKA